ncbi:MAG TPA: DUF58 domain-containing protein [Pyrinomonadaceae bacterium]|nr:DUF58 domain-containing protein [Pyrinomonadaceae bacterium]
MQLGAFRQLFSLRDVRNAALGFIVLFGGLGLAGVTYYAHLTSQPRLAGIAAGASLVFVLLILIFVVPPLARSASREASQLNLPFELTPGGAVMLVLVAIVGFSAWNTANNLLFLVLSFMTAAMIVGFFAGSICLKKLEVKMRFPETIFAGEETSILVNLSNRKKVFPSYSVVAEVRGREREESVAAEDLRRLLPALIANRLSKAPTVRRTLDYFVHIPRSEECETKSTHVFAKRGRFLIKDFELSTKFPFGFFRHRRRLPAKETELIVFPGLTPLDNQLSEIPAGSGKIAANRRGSGQDLLSLRDYRPNDDLRRVDWKATGRTDRLTVREFSDEDDRRVTIILDTFVGEEAPSRMTLRDKLEAEQLGESPVLSERFERGVSMAASLMAHFSEEQAEIRLYVNGELGEFGLGSRHLHGLFKQLAVLEPAMAMGEQPEPDLTPLASDLEEADNSHNFLLTTRHVDAIPAEITRKSTVIAL